MKISSIWKQIVRTAQFSLAALVCSVALNFATPAPSLAAQVQVLPAPQIALFGFGRQAEGKAEELAGKIQSKTGAKLDGSAKQVSGRAKSDIGRVESAAERNADRAGDMAKDMKKSAEKNLSKAQDDIKDAANNAIDTVKNVINK
jgi:uncharacterized protein YjbJ (UPF0337 family)